MADFNWYLNKQGARGIQGEKGDTGYSPYITVNDKGVNEITLSIHNENETLETPNLKANLISYTEDTDGTYVRFNPTTKQAYVSHADEATTAARGEVILATIHDVVLGADREPDFGTGATDSDVPQVDSITAREIKDKVVTPAVLVDSLKYLLANNDNNIVIEQSDADSRTYIDLADTLTIEKIYNKEGYRYLTKTDFYETGSNPVRVRSANVGDKLGVTYYLNYDTGHFSSDSGKLVLSNNIINTITSHGVSINNLSNDLATERQVRLNADNQLQAAIDAERRERENQDAALSNSISNLSNSYVTLDTYQSIPAYKSFDSMYVRELYGDVLGSRFLAGNGFKIGYDNVDVGAEIRMDDSNTLRIKAPTRGWVEINGVSFKTLESGSPYYSRYVDGVYTTDYFLRQDSIIAGDNITVEKSGQGIRISSTGGGGSSYVLPIASASTLGGIKGGNWLTVNQSTGKLECGELSYTQYQNALGYTFISKTTLENRLANLPTGGATIDDENVSTTKVFSSSKTSDLIGEVGNNLQDLSQRVDTIESLKVPNVVRIGNPMIVQGQVSDLDENNHLQFPFIIERKGRPFTCYFEFTTGADITRQQNIIDSKCSVAVAIRNSRLVGALSTNGTTFNLGERTISNFVLQPYTTYYCKLTGRLGVYYYYDLSIGINENERDAKTYSQSWQDLNPIYPTTMTIGSDGNSFDGVLDLNKWSLEIDGELAWLGMDNVGQAVSANVSLSNINDTAIHKIESIVENYLGDIPALLDEILGVPTARLAQELDNINGEEIE